MNITEIIIKNLNAGQLQRLAREIITRKEPELVFIDVPGGVEGTSKTRPGVPDVYGESNCGEKIYIEVTSEPRKGKVISDVEGCIKKLKGEKNARIISFLGFDPQEDTISECKKKCNESGFKYELYNNSKIAKIVDDEFPELKVLYIENIQSSDIVYIDLQQEQYYMRLKYVVDHVSWLEKTQKNDVYNLAFELVDNAIKHGRANSIKLQISEFALRLVDDGIPFNIDCPNDIRRIGGGIQTLEYFKSKYNGVMYFNYQRLKSMNIHIIAKKRLKELLLKTNASCEINVPFFTFGRSELYDRIMKIEISEKCNPIVLNMSKEAPPISIMREIIDEIIMKIPKGKNIKILTSHDKKDFLEFFLDRNGLSNRVEIIISEE